MTASLKHISALSLFVEDLQATKDFYQKVFDVPVVYEDENSAVVKFENFLINLLRVENAEEIVRPGNVASRNSGSRFQLSIWVEDVQSVHTRLKGIGVAILAGPEDRSWGMRTINFVDPAGHSWEVAQKISGGK